MFLKSLSLSTFLLLGLTLSAASFAESITLDQLAKEHNRPVLMKKTYGGYRMPVPDVDSYSMLTEKGDQYVVSTPAQYDAKTAMTLVKLKRSLTAALPKSLTTLSPFDAGTSTPNDFAQIGSFMDGIICDGPSFTTYYVQYEGDEAVGTKIAIAHGYMGEATSVLSSKEGAALSLLMQDKASETLRIAETQIDKGSISVDLTEAIKSEELKDERVLLELRVGNTMSTKEKDRIYKVKANDQVDVYSATRAPLAWAGFMPNPNITAIVKMELDHSFNIAASSFGSGRKLVAHIKTLIKKSEETKEVIVPCFPKTTIVVCVKEPCLQPDFPQTMLKEADVEMAYFTESGEKVVMAQQYLYPEQKELNKESENKLKTEYAIPLIALLYSLDANSIAAAQFILSHN